ncbi:MAG: hypothetical protein ACRDUY_03825 [Nitriliruptorales bacterium]
MNPYRNLDDAYQRLARHPARLTIASGPDGDLDAIVAAIRDDTPDSEASDQALRHLIAAGRSNRDALTVVLYALAPELRARISRTATGEYHADALGDLALVILSSDLDRRGLAHRLVNGAHNRVWRNARRVHTRGVVNITTTVPCPPDRLARLHDHRPVIATDVADAVVNRLDLQRFQTAIETAVAEGKIPPEVWVAYRDHRLHRAVAVDLPRSSSRERVAAHRAARRLAPYIDTYLGLHAA